MSNDWFSAEQLDAVTELIPVGIIRMDPNGSCVHVNTRWSTLTGLSPAQALGDGWKGSVAPEDRERVIGKITDAGAETGEFAEEFRLRTPEGGGRIASCRVLPLRAASGEVAGFLAAITDLTERHQTEAALRRLARELGDRIRELNCLIEISHIIEGSGESMPNIMQQSVELLASTWGNPDLAAYARIEIDGREYRTANYRRTPWRQSADLVVDGRRAGSLEVGYLERAPERAGDPSLEDERGVLDAVAERLSRTVERIESQELLRAREQELRERLTRLARINVMGEMAASIAHEVNQPLAAIGAYAQGCRRLLEASAPADPTLLDAVRRIAGEAMRAGDIVHRLDHMARKRHDRRAACDLNDLIRDVLPLAGVDARLNDVRLVFEPQPELPEIDADGVQLQQVLLNLVRNAIDAMTDTETAAREATVRTSCPDGRTVEVAVSDHGCGLAPEDEARLFEPFFTTKETGIGMGLAISRSIVGAHGGRMWFTRNDGRGITFHFAIPVAPSRDESHDE